MQYGNYTVADRNSIQQAKNEMLQDLIDTVRELAGQDDFWLVKQINHTDLPGGALIDDGEYYTVGWKIDIPHMGKGERKPIQVIVDGEVVGELARGQ